MINLEYFIAKRLFSAKEENNTHSKAILRIAIFAIALSVSIMLLSVTVLTGFKNEIKDKIIGFGSHITITKLSDNNSYESEPISSSKEFYRDLIENKSISNISVFACKAGIIKTNHEISGVVLKGIGSDYNWSFFSKHLIKGKVLNINDSSLSNSVIISENISKKLKLSLDDDLVMYFAQKPTRVRKFKIVGIYNTNLSEFDKLYVFGDIQHIRELNSWRDDQIGGFEVSINRFDDLDNMTDHIYSKIDYDLNAQNIKEINPQLFDWLNLQNMNVRVILFLMLFVGVINMTTALLILILDRTQLVGVLKALGANNWSVRKIFLFGAVQLIIKGLILGNAIGLGLALFQKIFSFIRLDSDIYYMSTVPIYFDFVQILILNIGTIFICTIVLILPSIIITKITPVKAIRFE